MPNPIKKKRILPLFPILGLSLLLLGSTTRIGSTQGQDRSSNIIPAPAFISFYGAPFQLVSGLQISVDPQIPETMAMGQYLVEKISPATGVEILVSGSDDGPGLGNIHLNLIQEETLGQEGYRLTITTQQVTLEAFQPAGLFRGIQTIRQLLPAQIDSPIKVSGTWQLPAGTIEDRPRFAYRGVMLDVARHFQGVDNVKKLIDQMAYYKFNTLHLHLANDQGWRIAIKGWDDLVRIGGQTQVGGNCPDCFYSQEEYAELVAYAALQYITIIPEIDMPGHVNAALVSYPDLNCNGRSPSPRTDTEVGYSSLCTTQPLAAVVSRFVTDVIAQLAELTPGPYIHIGGDESLSTPPEEYIAFISFAQSIVNSNGKAMIGWEEVAQIPDLSPSSIVHYWNDASFAQMGSAKGARILMSPCAKAYMDMKYDASTALGLDWCGYTSLQDAYLWDPGSYLGGLSEQGVLGVEGVLWSETILTMDDIEFLLWPRLAALAEIGWSPVGEGSWSEFAGRLATHGPRWELLGIDYFVSPDIAWQKLDELALEMASTPSLSTLTATAPGSSITSVATPLPTSLATSTPSEDEPWHGFSRSGLIGLIKEFPGKFLLSAALFFFLFLTGFWTSHSGKPVNAARMNIHKFITLGTAAFLAFQGVQYQQNNGWQTDEVAVTALVALFSITAIITGGLSSLKQPVRAAEIIHKITPYLVVITTILLLFLLAR